MEQPGGDVTTQEILDRLYIRHLDRMRLTLSSLGRLPGPDVFGQPDSQYQDAHNADNDVKR